MVPDDGTAAVAVVAEVEDVREYGGKRCAVAEDDARGEVYDEWKSSEPASSWAAFLAMERVCMAKASKNQEGRANNRKKTYLTQRGGT
jgi:hypothetical protein